jgi:hypothetical protein
MDKEFVVTTMASKLTDHMVEILVKTDAVKTFLAEFNPYATVSDFAKFTGIPAQTIYGWVREGRLSKNGSTKIYLKDLQKFVASKEMK